MTDNPIFAGPRHRIRRWRNYGMSMGFGVGIEFLFRDDFLTDEAAPLTSPRTAEPGPGIETLIQTDGNFSIVAGRFTFPAQGTPAWGDQGFYSALTRASGLGLYFIMNFTAFGVSYWGYADDTNVNNNSRENGYVSGAGGAGVVRVATNVAIINDTVFTMALGTDYEFFVILRDNGGFNLTKVGDNWVLDWVDTAENAATVYVFLANFSDVGTMDNLRVSQLPSPWDTDYGIATDRLAGARNFGDQFIHEADFLGEFIQTTVPTAGFTSFQFRRQDVNNYWAVIVEPSQDLSLSEVVAGVPTQRGIAVGIVNNGDRIVAIADGATIRVYEQNTLRITYALAANFQTETDGSLLALGVGGAVSDIVTWPRVLSGSALRALDRVADA